jgi:hypothetical protein
VDKISARHQNWSKGDEATRTAERNSAATQIPNRNTNNHRRRSGQAETARNQNRRARAQKRAEANGNTITKTPDPTTAAAPTADDDPKRGNYSGRDRRWCGREGQVHHRCGCLHGDWAFGFGGDERGFVFLFFSFLKIYVLFLFIHMFQFKFEARLIFSQWYWKHLVLSYFCFWFCNNRHKFIIK